MLGTRALRCVRLRLAARAGAAIAAPGPLQGMLDEVTCGLVRGWARDEARPGERVRLQVLADGMVVGETIADLARPDVARAGFGDGLHGFALAIPGGLPARIRMVEVRRVDDGASLPGSPMSLAAAA